MALDIKTFHKTLRYQDTIPVYLLDNSLSQIAEQDRSAFKKTKKYNLICILCGIAAFICFFVASTYQSWFLGFLVIVLILSSCIFAFLSKRWRSLDVPYQRYQFPRRLAEMFSRDMDREALLDISIDFSSATHKKKKTCTVPFPARTGWKMDCFEDPWLQIGGRFLDRTSFSMTLIEKNVSRYGWKRGSSGKSKFKRKQKFKGYNIRLLLVFPRKTYGAIALLAPDLHEAIRLPPGVELSQLKINDHRLILQVKVPGNCAVLRAEPDQGLYQIVTQLLLSLYQGLNLSKELTQVTR